MCAFSEGSIIKMRQVSLKEATNFWQAKHLSMPEHNLLESVLGIRRYPEDFEGNKAKKERGIGIYKVRKPKKTKLTFCWHFKSKVFTIYYLGILYSIVGCLGRNWLKFCPKSFLRNVSNLVNPSDREKDSMKDAICSLLNNTNYLI